MIEVRLPWSEIDVVDDALGYRLVSNVSFREAGKTSWSRNLDCLKMKIFSVMADNDDCHGVTIPFET